MPAADRERIQNVLDVCRQNDADGHHAVVARVGRIHPAVAGAEPDLAFDPVAQLALDRAGIERQARCLRRFRHDLDQRHLTILYRRFPAESKATGAGGSTTCSAGWLFTSSSSASDTHSSSSTAVFLMRQTRGSAASDENNATSMASRSEGSTSGSGPSRVLPPGSDAV